jgi:GNAT superfamily N-acetyltransferase
MEYRELTFASVNDPALAEIATLLSSEWTGFSPASLYRKYAGNPHALPGTAHFICVYDEGSLVAANGYLPARFRIGNRSVLGVQDCDSFVKAECRGKGIFSGLVRRAEASYGAMGYDFLYGFPNVFSRGAYEKLGWTFVRDIDYVGKPLLLAPQTRGQTTRAGLRIEPISVEAAAVLESYPENEVRLELGKDFAAWRFPAARGLYEAFLATDSRGECAHAITAYNEDSGALKICVLGGSSSEARIALLRQLGRRMGRRVKRILACAPNDSSELSEYRRAGFLTPSIMRFVKHSTTTLICKELSDRSAPTDLSWRIQYADYDTI